MSNLKHTPGPWRIASQNKQKQFYVIHGQDPTADRELQVVKIDYGYHPAAMQQGMTLANARLIAASPDLLEALLEILPLAEGLINTNHPAHLKAAGAIAKATGTKQPA